MSTVTTASAGSFRPSTSVAVPCTRTVPGRSHDQSGGRFQTTGSEPRAPSGYTGVTVCGSTGRSLGTVNTAVSWVRCTVSSTGVHRWLAPEVGVLPDTVSPVPSSSTPVAAFTNVQLPSPVVDMIH